MNRRAKTRTGACLALSAGLLLLAAASPLHAQEGAVEGHIHQVLTEASGTPEGQGLLAVAEAEAAVAIRHAELAASDDTYLDWMQTHARHVLHALDPSRVEEGGPGLGYGLQRAAEGIARHIGAAADVQGSSQNVETHAAHVVAASNAVASRAAELAEVAQEVLDAYDYTTAGSRIYDLRRIARELQSGVDADEDGQISWRAPEGGLDQVRQHLELMARGEGLASN